MLKPSDKPNNRALTVMAIIAVTVGALLFRAHNLGDRPMHHDEANQALRTGELLEHATYVYDPHEHHGPTLYMITAAVARLRGIHTPGEMSEAGLRGVPVVFGGVLILLLLLMADDLGGTAAVTAACLTAVSPGLVYFSRFYIQETLLVFFTFAMIVSGWRYARTRACGWAVACGLSAGLMYATKETCILAWAAMATALFFLPAVSGRPGPEWQRTWRKACPTLQHGLAALAAATVVSVCLYSSFFSHWRGVLDSVLAYGTYLGRAATDTRHAHPSPFFYLHRLTAFRNAPGPIWTEGIIMVLALVPIVALFTPIPLRRHLTPLDRFLALYALSLTFFYSIIVYKTPWCALSFLHGFTLLAGIGFALLLKSVRTHWGKSALLLILGLGILHLGHLAVLANGRYCADERNPYAYVPTVRDFLNLVHRVDDLAALSTDGTLRIHVIAPPDSYWPLPWYLRRYPQVGYWSEPDPAATGGTPPLVITTPQYADRVEAALGGEYIAEFYGLRPNVLLAVLIKKDLWQRFLDLRQTAVRQKTDGPLTRQGRETRTSG